MKAERKYLESKVLTASKEELMLMLFDGAIRFSGLAKERIGAGDYEESCRLLLRGQDIMIELMAGLRREDLGDRIHDNLMGLYQSVRARLARANVHRDPALVDEAVRLLANLRETWAMSIEKDRKERLGMLTLSGTAAPEGGPPRAPLNLEG